MTHAIYIAVILVLAVMFFVLLAGRNSAEKRAEAEERNVNVWRRIAEQNGCEADGLSESLAQCQRQLHAESGLVDGQIDEIAELSQKLNHALARLRSYKGWNGRYRRRIAELEAELADERGEV